MTQRVFSAPKKTRHNVGTKKILSNSEEGDGNTKPKIEMTSCQRPGSCENERNEGTRYKSTFHTKCCRQCAIVQICRSRTLFLVFSFTTNYDFGCELYGFKMDVTRDQKLSCAGSKPSLAVC